jgi:DHA1 family tetracycline resistance protein-like MFS transporter
VTEEPNKPVVADRRVLFPLYAAGFVTAFGAHSIAASLGIYAGQQQASLWTLGLLLAVYDGAEVLLKPVFGTLADRIGPRPVLLGGLIAFTIASAGFVVVGNPALLGIVRLGQGAAAAAFSPAAGAMVARLSPGNRQGRVFGGYGAFKSLGYATGPIIGGLLITAGGYSLLFATLSGLALAVTGWAALAVPTVPPLPRARQTVLDLARRLGSANFLQPTMTLAGATAALAVGVGFLPVVGGRAGMTPLVTGAAVSLLAVTGVFVQPWAGRARDTGRLRDRSGMSIGLGTAALGLLAGAVIPGIAGNLVAALLIGAGTGLATPVAFAHLAGTTPAERLGQTMGAAEVGRELGDAGGPLLVGSVAAVLTLSWGLAALALVLTVTVLAVLAAHPAPGHRPQSPR